MFKKVFYDVTYIIGDCDSDGKSFDNYQDAVRAYSSQVDDFMTDYRNWSFSGRDTKLYVELTKNVEEYEDEDDVFPVNEFSKTIYCTTMIYRKGSGVRKVKLDEYNAFH